jgi:hypothetical protein
VSTAKVMMTFSCHYRYDKLYAEKETNNVCNDPLNGKMERYNGEDSKFYS